MMSARWAWLPLLVLCGCAAGPASLRPGVSMREDVLAAMGPPALRWSLPEGGERLSYPSGPDGYQSFMASVDAGGRLVRIENVLREPFLDRIAAGMSEDDVIRLIGPSVPGWTAEFDARNERVLEWRYCSQFSQIERFDVLFDRTSRTVRSTQSVVEQCGRDVCFCGH
jgi:outer membrane protein assembly factor BamE (lipoprotein component of BamABCDE complex)